MKRILMALVVVGVMLAAGLTLLGHSRAEGPPPLHSAEGEFKPQIPPVPVPEASFLDADGQPLNLSSFKGKLTLVNLWATWCAPCVAEMPSLEQLKAARGGDKFDVVTISEDTKSGTAVADFFDKHRLHALPRYADPKNEMLQHLALAGLPTTLLLDAEGRELGRMEGGIDWNGPAAHALIDWYLAHSSSSAGSSGVSTR